MSGETVYCDNYDEIKGNVFRSTVQVETKVVSPDEPAEPQSADVQVETKDAE